MDNSHLFDEGAFPTFSSPCEIYTKHMDTAYRSKQWFLIYISFKKMIT